MTFDIASSLTGGVKRVANRNGLLLGLAYSVLGIGWLVVVFSAYAQLLEGTEFEGAVPSALAVDAPLAALAAGGLVALLAMSYVYVVAIRTFVGGHTRSIPGDYYTRNAAFVLLNTVVGSIAYSVVVMIGSLLVIPGMIAYVAFIFLPLYVAVEDESFVAAFRDSWALTRGNWIRLFVLLIVMGVGVAILGTVLSVAVSIGAVVVANEEVATILSSFVYLPLGLLAVGILAEAFDQLRGDRTGGGHAEL